MDEGWFREMAVVVVVITLIRPYPLVGGGGARTTWALEV